MITTETIIGALIYVWVIAAFINLFIMIVVFGLCAERCKLLNENIIEQSRKNLNIGWPDPRYLSARGKKIQKLYVSTIVFMGLCLVLGVILDTI